MCKRLYKCVGLVMWGISVKVLGHCMISPKDKLTQITFQVLSCQEVNVDDSKFFQQHRYQGVTLDVKVTSPKNTKKFIKLFYGLQPKPSCDVFKWPSVWRSTMALACCDGSPEVPCLLGYDKRVETLIQLHK